MAFLYIIGIGKRHLDWILRCIVLILFRDLSN
jgi:hypothetical protein